jgi:hypothetical protein
MSLYYHESIINTASLIHSNHFEVQASCARCIPTSAMRALGPRRKASMFISSGKQMPKSRNLTVDLYSFNPSSRYKQCTTSVSHITGKFVDGPWSQPTPDSMTRDIACQARDAQTVELDSGTKDPSTAWFDGMWAASFRLEKRV